jgi:phage terminase large subunit-like protein
VSDRSRAHKGRGGPIDIEPLLRLDARGRKRFLDRCSPHHRLLLLEEASHFARHWARPNQLRPPGVWKVWVCNAGRGWGKTRVGAEETHTFARDNPGRHLALVARTAADARDTMIEGESGILSTGSPLFRAVYEPSKRRVVWPNGCWGTVYSADKPDLLRGPNIAWFWADELAAWRYARKAWDNLMFTLRAGADPRGIVTTTPKPVPLYRELLKEPDTVISGGSTFENAENLAASFLALLQRKYSGTTLGRQELEAELLDEAEGALWKRAWLERDRILTPEQLPELDRLVVAIDPAVTSGEESAECGIVVAGAKYHPAPIPDDFYVLADLSARLSPLAWAKRSIDAAERWRADRIVAEVNNGGDLVETTLRTLRQNIAYRTLHASRGKRARAEPVSALSEQHCLHMLGYFAELEDELCNWDPQVSTESPNRLDAMVWAVTELANHRGVPQFSLEEASGLDRVSHWTSFSSDED